MHGAKKLAVVSATSLLVTAASMKNTLRSLERVLCIYHPLRFRKDLRETRALIDWGGEINALIPVYAAKLGLKVQKIDIGAQKIDGSTLDTFEMVLTSFQVEDKLKKTRFFQETFLLADISTEMVLGIPFLTLSNADVQFVEKKLTWRTYNPAKTLPSTKQVELIDKKEFATVALYEKSETFVVHIVSLNLTPGIHPDRAAQIASLLAKEVRIPDEYSDFADIFSEKKALVLPEGTKLNEYAINLEDGKQPLYGPIYSLGLVELETLKTYIETYLKTGFI